jgi:hypothetical protein
VVRPNTTSIKWLYLHYTLVHYLFHYLFIADCLYHIVLKLASTEVKQIHLLILGLAAKMLVGINGLYSEALLCSVVVCKHFKVHLLRVATLVNRFFSHLNTKVATVNTMMKTDSEQLSN